MIDILQRAAVKWTYTAFSCKILWLKEVFMENLFVSIGEFVATEIDDVKEVIYLDKALGCMFYIDVKDGKRYLLTLTEA